MVQPGGDRDLPQKPVPTQCRRHLRSHHLDRHVAAQLLVAGAEDAGEGRVVQLKPGETVMFSWIVFKSRAHRDRVNAKVMKDPRLTAGMEAADMPFDCKRMVYGGFKSIVEF